MTNAGATDSALTGEAPLLAAHDLHVHPTSAPDAAGLHGLDLTIEVGEIHAIIGPDDSGTAVIGPTLLGAPACSLTSGSIRFRHDDVTAWPVDERAKAGMFLATRRPHAIPGVTTMHLLRRAVSAHKRHDLSVTELRRAVSEWAHRLGLDIGAADQPVDDLASDSDRALTELLQVAILEPELVILDETGPSRDPAYAGHEQLALGIDELRSDRDHLSVLLIAPSPRLLDEVVPDRVHLLIDGRITASGGLELAQQAERDGHESFQKVGV